MTNFTTRTMWMAPRCIRRVEDWKLVQIVKLCIVSKRMLKLKKKVPYAQNKIQKIQEIPF